MEQGMVQEYFRDQVEDTAAAMSDRELAVWAIKRTARRAAEVLRLWGLLPAKKDPKVVAPCVLDRIADSIS